MRFFHFLVPAVLLIACDSTPDPVPVTPSPVIAPDTSTGGGDKAGTFQLVPLARTGLRFDGVYHFANDNLKYYMRFFERGSAAFVGGTEQYKGQLAEMLTINVRSGWNQVHNCPVTQRNDSLFIRSVGIKGVINYLGEVRANGDSVRFLRVSEINGSRTLVPYVFITDEELKQERPKSVQPVNVVGG